MAKNGASARTINVFLRYQFGAHQAVAESTISVVRAHRSAADAIRTRAMRVSLTDHHDRVLEQALEADPSTMTEELQAELVRHEPAGGRTSQRLRQGRRRSHYFPASTIDDRLRLRGYSHKFMTLYNERRCPRLSARVRNALRDIDIENAVFVDAMPLRYRDFCRRMGRSKVGKKALGHTAAMSNGGVLKTIMGVFMLTGFVMSATKILDGPVDTEKYNEWAFEYLSNFLEPHHTVVL